MQIGIDEVGRGCWAGPLVAAAVMLQQDIVGLNDSKVLSKKRRDQLAEKIHATADVGLGWVSAFDVDKLGLTEAVRLAMQRAIDGITSPYESVIIDGNYNYLSHLPGTEAIIKADGSIPSVSAASIIAKVARDNYMRTLPEQYSVWEFDKHVGYGTKLHRDLLIAFGISDLHRTSYKPIRALTS